MLDEETKYQLDRFKLLYSNSVSVDRIPRIDSEDYVAFSAKKGLPVKLVYSDKHYKYFPNYPPFFDFFTYNDYFWIIPCVIPENEFIGFILKSYSPFYMKDRYFKKLYMNFSVKGAFPLLYGWEDFSDYQKGNPIILCEGVKDAIFLKKYYKYVIAVLTSVVTVNLLSVIGSITDKVIIAFDNDKAGKSGATKAVKSLSKLGVVTSVMASSYDVGDWGNFFSVDVSNERVDSHMNAIIRSSMKNVGYVF